MSDSAHGNGNGGTRLEKAANNVVLTLVSRILMVGVVPLGAWAAGTIYNATQENTKATVRIETSLLGVAEQIKELIKKNDKQDEQIDKIRDRLPARP